MTNLQAGMKYRTTAQIAELCLQSAEDYHQQYVSDVENPSGYCLDHGTGVASIGWVCPIALWISWARSGSGP